MTYFELRGRRIVRRLDTAGYPATARYFDWWTRPRGPSMRGVLAGMKLLCLALSMLILAEVGIAFWLR
jgi:hypothetical protein